MNFDMSNSVDLDKLVFSYVEGLQWVLLYYYHGVPSWGWFYPYHYAPKISDIRNFSHLDLKFNQGTPFLPFQQLMGVLPAASRSHIPEVYRDLMIDPGSPIIDLYPSEFDCDQNGKKASWEAIVLIPFIDEERLIRTLAIRDKMLSKEEQIRNSIGNSILFKYDPTNPQKYSSVNETFPDILNCYCKMSVFDLPVLHSNGYVNGLNPNARVGINSLPGFPSLYTIPHSATLGFHGVNVFNSDSTSESIVLNLKNLFDGLSSEDILKRLGSRGYFNYPFLAEGLITGISDELFSYKLEKVGNRLDVVKIPHSNESSNKFQKSSESSEIYYSKKCGTVIGHVVSL